MFDEIQLNFEFGAVQKVRKRVILVDLVKSFETHYLLFEPGSYSNEYLLTNIGVIVVENGPLKVCLKLASSWKKS